MEIIISADKKIREIQEEFNQQFPYLKIEFFKKSHGEGEASPLSDLIDSNKTIREISSYKENKPVKINSFAKVSTFEIFFLETYGLSVQIFRKSGKKWLQTTTTDHWTLIEQNEEGKNASVLNP